MDTNIRDIVQFFGGMLNVSLLLMLVIVIIIVQKMRKNKKRNQDKGNYLDH